MEESVPETPPKVFISKANSYLNSHILAYLISRKVPFVLGVEEQSHEQEYSYLKEIGKALGCEPQIELVDYNQESSLRKAIKGCTCFIHPLAQDNWYHPTDPVEYYKKPVSDTLLMIDCASKEGLTYGVLSSSLVSVYGGLPKSKIEVVDSDWGEPKNMTPQSRAYLYAERAAWAYNNTLPEKLNLTVLNMGTLFGPPLLLTENHASVKFVMKLMNGTFKGLLPVKIPTLDVRDAALVHVLFILSPPAESQRFNLCQGVYSLADLAHILNDEFSYIGIKITTSEIGRIPALITSWFNSSVKANQSFFHCSKNLKVSNFRIREAMAFRLRSLDETLSDMGHFIVDNGGVKEEGELEDKNKQKKNGSSSSGDKFRPEQESQLL